MVLAIVISVPSTIYWQYDAAPQLYGCHCHHPLPFANAVEAINKLKAQAWKKSPPTARLERPRRHVAKPKTPRRLRRHRPHYLRRCFGRLKYRVAIAPRHLRLLRCIRACACPSPSHRFLLKFLITKYGGGKMYQRCKPMMIGLIAGTLAAQFVPMVVGTIYYFITGKTL
jgi:hypothetical protein